MENSENEKTLNLAKEEYYFCQGAANEIDRQTLTFKHWSIIFSSAAFGWAFTQDQAVTALSPAVFAFLFWYSEGLWKEKKQNIYRSNKRNRENT